MNKTFAYLGVSFGMVLSCAGNDAWAVACNTDPATMAAAQPCGDDVSKLPQGTVCRAPWGVLHPTQSAVGRVAVECKKNKIIRKINDLDETLREGIVPVVVGPGIESDGSSKGSALYLTDHHHFASAVMYAEKEGVAAPPPNWNLYLCVEGNYLLKQPDMSGDDFVSALEKATPPLLWTHDIQGNLLTNPKESIFVKKPSLAVLDDDPYRTLSAWSRAALGWIKCEEDPKLNSPEVATYCAGHPTNPAYFMEFYWADYFKSTLSTKDVWSSNLDKQANALWKLYPDSLKVAQQKLADGLSGYNPGTVSVQKLELIMKGDKKFCTTEAK